MLFNEHFIIKAIPNVSILHNTFPEDFCFSIDSRTVQAGDFFIALTGMHSDGHDFIEEVFKKGAVGCMINASKQDVLHTLHPDILKNKLVLVVPDTLQALLQLAQAWRAQFTYPVVSVTGSVGKTSTKELIANILRAAGKSVIASRGNQNTKIGVALNILRMRDHHDFAIFELGISKRGEMAELAYLVQATTAIITNIGHQHMDGLGSIQNIALEKRDIFKYFTEKNIGIIHGDQPLLTNVSYPFPVIKFGLKTINQLQARKIRIRDSSVDFILKIYKQKYQITLPQPHMGRVLNSLAAASVAHLLGVPEDVIVRAIQAPLVVDGRFEPRQLKSISGVLINDCYNASPESMKESLLAFQHIQTNAQKIAVIGDMLGLGADSPFWHRHLGRLLRKVPSLKHVILVGDLVQWTHKVLPAHVTVDKASDWQTAVSLLNKKLTKESLVLVKGSLGVGLGNLVNEVSLRN
jgi:UDP-N-acetylmuramoyl-tripeptide--D-alanyl-D-alanine ligase